MTMTDQELAIFRELRDGLRKILDESSKQTHTLLEICIAVRKLEEHTSRPLEAAPPPPTPEPHIHAAHKTKPARKH